MTAVVFRSHRRSLYRRCLCGDPDHDSRRGQPGHTDESQGTCDLEHVSRAHRCEACHNAYNVSQQGKGVQQEALAESVKQKLALSLGIPVKDLDAILPPTKSLVDAKMAAIAAEAAVNTKR